MAPCKHTILFLLMIVWLLERVISCENLSHPKNLSAKNRESHAHDEDFDLFTKLAVKNQSKTEVDETEYPGTERKSNITSQSEEVKGDPYTNSTANDGLLTNNTKNGTESTEDKWDFSKIFEYFLSFIQKLDTEEDKEMQKNLAEISKDDQPHVFDKNKFSMNKEECRTDSCESIPKKEHHRSIGMNPDMDFDNGDKINDEETQNLQEDSQKLEQNEGGISEKNFRSISENEVDSNPDVAFDKDDKFERSESLKSKDNQRVTRKDNKDISVNNPASKHESKGSIPEAEKAQNPQHISKISKQDEGRISEEKLKSISESEEDSQSVDSNLDVTFDADDRFERTDSLEGEDDSNMTREDEDISVNNPALQQEGDDVILKVDYHSDFVFSGEEGSDLTGEDASRGTQNDQIKGNDFIPHESELSTNQNEHKEKYSDVDEQERIPGSKEISDSNSSSISDLNSSQENKRTHEQPGVKPKFNPELHSENSTETSVQDKTYSIETESKFENENKYYEEDYIDEDEEEYDNEYEYENEYEDEYEDEDEYEEENDDEETYEFETLYDFQEGDDNYYDDETEYILENFFPPQTNDNIMGTPQVITDEPHDEKNYTYSNFPKPPEAFDTILEYLYKYSNNPLFISLKQENNTEAKNRTM